VEKYLLCLGKCCGKVEDCKTCEAEPQLRDQSSLLELKIASKELVKF
jgi:hypothetical protein